MQFDWKSDYELLVDELLKQHFGGPHLSRVFPSMRGEYRWGKHRPPVGDARIPAKNNTEYHGLELHACQYHATAQYEFAYHHWLMAGYWRVQDARANNFRDAGHENAVRYCVRQAIYNKALHEWQQSRLGMPPQPELFELTRADIDRKTREAESQIEAYVSKSKT